MPCGIGSLMGRQKGFFLAGLVLGYLVRHSCYLKLLVGECIVFVPFIRVACIRTFSRNGKDYEKDRLRKA